LFTLLIKPRLAARRQFQPAVPAAETAKDLQAAHGLAEKYLRTIDQEEIAGLPLRQYQGEVSVVNTPAALVAAMRDIRDTRVVGFDTETRTAFGKGESYLPCLMQIATASREHLLQLEQVDCAKEMAELMGNPRIIKAGVALAGDVGQLKRLFPYEAAALVGLGHIAKRHGNHQTGLRNLSALLLGWSMAKGEKNHELVDAAIEHGQTGYDATDAWASREPYLSFEKLGLAARAEA